jgi:multiple sugar transport system permease protein
MTANASITAVRSSSPPRRRRKISVGKIIAWVFLGFAILTILFPFWWIIRTALSTQREMLSAPNSLMPVGITTINFARVLGQVDTATAVAAGGSGQKIDFLLYLRNSIIVTVTTVVGQVFFSALAAYAFARLEFPGRNKIFFLYVTGLMIPGIVTLIPNFILIRQLHWENTFLGIVAPTLLMTPFAVFFLRQFYLGLNRELEEAAKLDGCGIFGVFWRVIVPLTTPALVTIGILTFVGTWNTYLWPFLVGQNENVRVLTVALGIFRSQTPQGAPDWSGLMAATIVAMIPTLLVFLVVGRRVVNNIQFTGFK